MKEVAAELISAPSVKPVPQNQNPDEGYGDSSSEEEEVVDEPELEDSDLEQERKKPRLNHMAIITALNAVATLDDLVNGIDSFYSQVKLVYSQIGNLTVLHVRSKITDGVWENIQYRSKLDTSSPLNLNVPDQELENISFQMFLDFLKNLTNDFKSGGGRGLDDQLAQLKMGAYFSLDPSEMQQKAGALALRLSQLKRVGEQSPTGNADARICKNFMKKLKLFAEKADGKAYLLPYARSFFITFNKVIPVGANKQEDAKNFDTLWKERNIMEDQKAPEEVGDLKHRF